MTVSSPLQSKSEGVPAAIEQVYLTHCAQTDSYRNEAGFSVRASSTDNAALLKFALDYPGLELPLDMLGSDPTPDQAPRRLALIEAPSGRALVHSVFVPLDTRGRPGNYFTHILLYPRLPLTRALETWGSEDWVVGYRPGEPRDLKPFARGLPAPPRRWRLDEAFLGQFLKDPQCPSPTGLALATCPPRLQEVAGVTRRQELLRMALTGCLLALREGAGPRRTFYLLAEPGLCAALLYGVARLLPGRQVEGLTFSTYEPMHRSFRQFKGAQVVCTYLKDPGRGLDSDFTHTRGYGLDTFNPARSSPELQTPDPVVRELVAWATAGDWGAIRDLHRLHGVGPITPDSLRFARRLMDLSRRLERGQVKLEEMTDLLGNEQGKAFVEEHEDGLWRLVSEASLTSPQLRQDYGYLLRKRFGELKRDAAGHLSRAGWERWGRYWALIEDLRKADRENLPKDFLEVLRHARGPDGYRDSVREVGDRLLKQWRPLGTEGEPPREVKELLAPATAAELERLCAAGLPQEWTAHALFQALHRTGETRLRAAALLRGANPDLMPAFLGELRSRAAGREAEYLGLLFDGDGDGADVFDRILGSAEHLPAQALGALLNSRQAFGHGWDGFWATRGRLARLFGSLQAAPELTAQLWGHYTKRVTREVLLGDATQAGLLAQLREACRRAGKSVPAAARQAIEEWGLLYDLFTHPDTLPHTPAEVIEDALKGRGVDKLLALKEWIRKSPEERSTKDPAFQAFLTTFVYLHQLWSRTDTYQSQLHLFQIWLQVTEAFLDEERRSNAQLYFLLEKIDPRFQAQVAEECLQKQELSPTAADYARKKWPPPKPKPATKGADAPSPKPRPVEQDGDEPAEKRGWGLLAVLAMVGAASLVSFVVGWLARGGGQAPPPGPGKKHQVEVPQPQTKIVVQKEKVKVYDTTAVKELADTVKTLRTAFVLDRVIDGLGGRDLLDKLATQTEQLAALAEKGDPREDQKAAEKLTRDLKAMCEAIRGLCTQMEQHTRGLSTAKKEEVQKARLMVEVYNYYLNDIRKPWQEQYVERLTDMVWEHARDQLGPYYKEYQTGGTRYNDLKKLCEAVAGKYRKAAPRDVQPVRERLLEFLANERSLEGTAKFAEDRRPSLMRKRLDALEGQLWKALGKPGEKNPK